MHGLVARLILAASAGSRLLPFPRGKDRFVVPLLNRLAWARPALAHRTFRARHDLLWSTTAFPDIMTRTMMVRGSYQDDVILALSALLGPGDTMFDIGAHHGLMTLVGSRVVGKAGRVVAFEPNPASRDILDEHLELNGADNVTVEALGVMDREALTPFYANRVGYSWNSTFIRDFAPAGTTNGALPVPTTSLDGYCERTGRQPALLKIDTEGSEFLVLRGAARTLERHRPHLILEFNPIAAANAGLPLEQMVAMLESLDYRLYVMRRNFAGHYAFERKEPLHAQDLGGNDWLRNVICISRRSPAPTSA
jgi:FkbM family methyltransferase